MTGTVSNLSFLCKRGREIRLGIGRRWVRPVDLFIVVEEGGLVGTWGSPLLPHLTSLAASRNKSATLLCVCVCVCANQSWLRMREGREGKKEREREVDRESTLAAMASSAERSRSRRTDGGPVQARELAIGEMRPAPWRWSSRS